MEEKDMTTATEERTFSQQEVEAIVAQVNMQARQQCEGLARKCQFLEEQLMYKRLDYLFKVVEHGGSFDIEFVQKCSEEIQAALTVPEQENIETEVKE